MTPAEKRKKATQLRADALRHREFAKYADSAQARNGDERRAASCNQQAAELERQAAEEDQANDD